MGEKRSKPNAGGFNGRSEPQLAYSAGGTITKTTQSTIFSLNGSNSPQMGITYGNGLGGTVSGNLSRSVTASGGLAGGHATFGEVGYTKVFTLVCR